MGDCCGHGTTPPAASCPSCGGRGEAINHTTLQHQLTTPWRQVVPDTDHYFCPAPGCQTVYFDVTGHAFTQTALRTAVGQKSAAKDAMLCYCFDIRYSDLTDRDTAHCAREFVLHETKHKVCACEVRNPAGRCCLRDFPKETPTVKE